MDYEVLAVRYGTRRTTKSEVFLNYPVFGEPDASIEMDYFFWVIRNDERTVVIDTGFSEEAATRRNRTMLESPVSALARLGIAADTVSQVVVTHAHYDHIGGLPEFSAAEVIMSRREYEFWTGPMARRPLFAALTDERELDHLVSLQDSGRLRLTGSSHTVAPGVEIVEVGGHTPGQLIVKVTSGESTTVLAADALHYYEELDRDRPFAVVCDVPDMYRAFDLLRDLSSDSRTTLVAGHDPAVLTRFPEDPATGRGIVRIAGSPPSAGIGRAETHDSRRNATDGIGRADDGN